MHAARHNRNPDLFDVLLDAGADSRAEDSYARAALNYIVRNEALKGTDAYWALNDRHFE